MSRVTTFSIMLVLKQAEIHIITLSGRSVLSEVINSSSKTLNLESLASGAYVLTAISADNRFSTLLLLE